MQDMLPRLASPLLEERLSGYPAAALIGPRQSGKTTLARTLGGVYFDLEQESERLRLDLEWDSRIRRDQLIVLDEAQAWPKVFARLRGAIDEDRKRNGRFLVLGSVSPSLMTQVSESLAGRLALVELTPLLRSELETKASRTRHWLTGGFADGGVLKPGAFPTWQTDYLRLLVQRDLPIWGLPARPQTTTRLIHMLAAVHGQVWNASQLGKSLGLSYHTINSYLDYLEGAFLIRRLQPFHANIKKRLVKRPKVYWRDSGVLHSILTVASERSLLNRPWVGASWEGYVIEQILGLLSTFGVRHRASYLRTGDRYEIDLLLEIEGDLWAIEVKLTASPGASDMDRLNRVADLVNAPRRFLISQTRRPAGNEHRASLDLDGFLDQLRKQHSQNHSTR